jgi:hypothetical protein
VPVDESKGDDKQVRPPVRLAIVSSVEGKHATAEDFFLVEASKLDGVELLERGRLDAVLREQKLSTTNLLSPETAVRIGRLLTADALVLVEAAAGGGKSADRIRLIETRGGVRLMDHPLASAAAPADRDALMADVRRCLGKLRAPEDRRLYVAAVGWHCEEPNDVLAGDARLLGVLLEQDLGALPDLVMLERDQARHVTAEQALANVGPHLRPAAVVIEGGLQRDVDGKHLIVSLVVHGPGAKSLRTARARIARDALVAERTAVLDALVAVLGAGRETAALVPVDEAALLAERAAELKSNQMPAEAAAVYQAAFTLAPRREWFDLGKSCYRDQAANYSLFQAERLRANLRGSRFAQQYVEWCMKHNREGDGWNVDLVFQFAPYVALYAKSVEEVLARDPRAKIWYDKTSGHEFYSGLARGDDDAEIVQLQREILRVQDESYELVAAWRREHKKPLDDLLLGRLVRAAYSVTPGEAKTEVITLLTEIRRSGAWARMIAARDASSARKYVKPPDPIVVLHRCINIMVDYRWHAEEVLPLLDWLTEQDDPAIHAAGLAGKVRLKGAAGKKAAGEFLSALSRGTAGVHKASLQSIVLSCMYYVPPADRAAWWALFQPARLTSVPQQPGKFIDLRPSSNRPSAGKGYGLRLVSLEATQEGAQIAHLVVDERTAMPGDGPVFIVWDLTGPVPGFDYRTYPPADEVHRYLVTRLQPESGKMKVIARFEMRVLDYRAAMAVMPGGLAFNLREGGMAVVRGERVAYFDELKGLSVHKVDTMVWFEDRLYVAGLGTLARFDPGKKQFEFLASSRSVAPRNGLDGGGQWCVLSILPDAQRRCLWLSVGRDFIHQNTGGEAKYGIWKFTPADDAFRRVVKCSPGYLAWSDEEILYVHCDLRKDPAPFLLEPQSEKTTPFARGPFWTMDTRRVTWVPMNGDVLSASGHVYEPNGRKYRLAPSGTAWDYVLPLGRGALVSVTRKRELWCVEPRLAVGPQSDAEGTTAEPVPQMRTWNITGRPPMEAELIGGIKRNVVLRKADGSTVSVPIDELSKADRDFILKMATER